jgi:hypothetical protein
MDTRRRIISITSCGLFLLSIAATRFVPAASRVASPQSSAPEACTLLTNADASTALEVSGATGKRIMADVPTMCVWSNGPALDSSRRVALVTVSLGQFQAAKHPAITTITVEPVPGVGDEAFYQIYPHDQSPFIWFRKGNTAVSIRILTKRKPAPFTDEQEKSKLAVLAKAAVAKL